MQVKYEQVHISKHFKAFEQVIIICSSSNDGNSQFKYPINPNIGKLQTFYLKYSSKNVIIFTCTAHYKTYIVKLNCGTVRKSNI